MFPVKTTKGVPTPNQDTPHLAKTQKCTTGQGRVSYVQEVPPKPKVAHAPSAKEMPQRELACACSRRWPERSSRGGFKEPAHGILPAVGGRRVGAPQFHLSSLPQSLPNKRENGTRNGFPGVAPLPQFHCSGGGDLNQQTRTKGTSVVI